jgi:hypothetical protein
VTKPRPYVNRVSVFFSLVGYTKPQERGLAMSNGDHTPRCTEAKIEKLLRHLEALRIADYMELLERPARLIMVNFIAGIARGLGIAVGATLVFGLMIEVFRRLILLHLPGIGNFIAEIVHIVEMKNGTF